jgi:TonB-dependent receptor
LLINESVLWFILNGTIAQLIIMKKLAILFTIIFVATGLFAQNGKIRGTIIEESTGETLVGVTVLLVGTTTGAMTDLDGQYTIEAPAGTYNVQFSYISYQTIVLENIKVESGEVKVLDDLIMKESSQELAEVVVTAEVIRTTEAALLTVKKKSASMLDGISSAKIRLTGDGTAVEAAKRVTGVSIEDGKYVYVRGLGDRYSKTTLNGVDIPGLDPDKNSLQMDIFPTNLINNIMVTKNFTAELPADFTGGLVNIETKDFPEQKTLIISADVSYNPDMHFNPDFISYKGGKTDFLGFDDGTRALPDNARGKDIPTPYSGDPEQEVIDFIKSFDPTLGATRQTSFANYSLSISTGNQLDLKSNSENSPKLGYIFSLTYKSEQTFYEGITYGEYQRYLDPTLNEMRYATIQEGNLAEQSTLLGGLAGLAYKTRYSKLKFTAMHLQNGLSSSGQFQIINDGAAVGQSGYEAGSDNLIYNERALTNLLLNGAHVLGTSGWEIDWRVSPTRSSSDDPDIRKTAFTYGIRDTSFSAGAGGNPSRIWRYLDEVNNTAKIDIQKDLMLFENAAKIKFGASHNYKIRDYEILFYDIQFSSSQKWENPTANDVLNDINLYPNRPNGIYYQTGNNDPNPNEYSSNVNNLAGYASLEFQPFNRLKTILGARVESFVQRHTGRDQKYAGGDTENGKNLDNAKVLDATDLFPSVNLIYSLTPEQNLRLAYAKTIARPSFKELSYAQIIDPISNRIFNGSLYEYPDWDGILVETRIDNADIRWEWFLKEGQIVSFSGFYKSFKNPIELVRIPQQQTSTEYQARNVGDGQLFGFEFELRKNMGFVAPALRSLSFSGNVTIVRSEIEMTESEFNSRKGYEKIGQTTEDTRVMAGQSPYVINAGFTYNTPNNDIETGLFYNVKGSTLTIVGAGLFPDIYVEPFHSLNFSINKKLGKDGKTLIDFKISNLLGETFQEVYKAYKAIDQPYEVYNPGRSFSLGISYNF